MACTLYVILHYATNAQYVIQLVIGQFAYPHGAGQSHENISIVIVVVVVFRDE